MQLLKTNQPIVNVHRVGSLSGGDSLVLQNSIPTATPGHKITLNLYIVAMSKINIIYKPRMTQLQQAREDYLDQVRYKMSVSQEMYSLLQMIMCALDGHWDT